MSENAAIVLSLIIVCIISGLQGFFLRMYLGDVGPYLSIPISLALGFLTLPLSRKLQSLRRA